ncbi:MAG: prepilin-type N-terminal cleavage/methylation domain-containing protein [Thiohalocapsa sp.]|nr:prepilin-type N-terminal cleavage/methylation domain-containing protein [Thiohalocapsa sp.]MCF7990818.1 prepilin-type N-terminal cleavage/methylation domain-containing protein [Thiohalocapsa sp.]
MPRPDARQRGFTLVELLIALTLIAMITVLMFSGLRLGTRAWEGVETVSERVADIRVARNFVEGILRQARPASVFLDGLELQVFAGDAERIDLVAPLTENVGIPGLYLLRFQLEQGGEHPRLVLVRWLLHPEVLAGGDDYPAWEPLAEAGMELEDAGPLDRDVASGAYGRTVLLPEVGEFGLAYFGISEGQQDPEWLDEWLEERRMPLAVRLTMTTPSQTWPTGVVALTGGDLGAFGGFDDGHGGGFDGGEPDPERDDDPN